MAPPEETPRPNPCTAFLTAATSMQTAMNKIGEGVAQFCHAARGVRPKAAPMRIAVVLNPANAEEIGRQVDQIMRRAQREDSI
ncbi:hypothetical protein [Streptomyces sp. NPDC060366]|uniref:hypothetical protein n=1 Tax=Streptomyces sp. NPDC060366 TaxID=3347105 RepID=UPI003653CD45